MKIRLFSMGLAVTLLSLAFLNVPFVRALHGPGPSVEITNPPADFTSSTSEILTVQQTSPEIVAYFYQHNSDPGVFMPIAEPIVLVGLSEGPHTLTVVGLDETMSQHGDTLFLAWTVDFTSPNLQITNVSGSPTNDRTPQLFIQIDGQETPPEGSLIRFSCDGGIFSSFEPAAFMMENFDVRSGSFGCTDEDGPKNIFAQAQDAAGNNSGTEETGPFELDTTPPNILGLQSNEHPVKTYTWQWSSSDNDASFRFLVDQSPDTFPIGPYEGPTFSVTQENGDGLFYIHLQAIDDIGNESLVYTASSLMDNTAPTAILNNRPHQPTSSPNMNVAVSGTDVESYRAVIDGETIFNNPVGNPIVMNGLASGFHTLAVTGIDSAGNEQSDPTMHTWEVDFNLITPQLTNLPSNPTTATNTAISVSGFNGFFKFSLDNGSFGEENIPSTGIFLSNLGVGTHTLKVMARSSTGQYPDPLDATVVTWEIVSGGGGGAPAPAAAASLFSRAQPTVLGAQTQQAKPKVLGAETSAYPDGTVLKVKGRRLYFLMVNGKRKLLPYGQFKKKYSKDDVTEVDLANLKSIPKMKKKSKKSTYFGGLMV